VTDHGVDITGTPGSGFWVLQLLLAAAAGYAVGVHRLRARGHHWPVTRSAAAAAGLCCLALAILPAPPGTGFPGHVVQHLLMAMLAPLLLALSAPVTLALRTAPVRTRRLMVAALHSRMIRTLMTAPVVLFLDVGGLYAYYLSPLYDVAHHQQWVQALVHLHMFLAGCLLSWYLVGRDPIPRRPTLPVTLGVLLAAGAGHDILAKLLYAEHNPTVDGSPIQLHLGAQMMYYGGNVIEVLLAVIVMTDWYQRSGRRLARERRRQSRTLVHGWRER
jgi:putative membrane protein